MIRSNASTPDIDVSSLKTFCTVGKEVEDLNGYVEAELLR